MWTLCEHMLVECQWQVIIYDTEIACTEWTWRLQPHAYTHCKTASIAAKGPFEASVNLLKWQVNCGRVQLREPVRPVTTGGTRAHNLTGPNKLLKPQLFLPL